MAAQPARPLRVSAVPERVVRLGVACRGRIIEERILPAGRPVTVGSHPRSTILLPSEDGPPERFELFSARGGRLHLRLPDGLRGKVDLGDGVVTLERLRAEHPGGAVVLSEDARGKVQVGEFTLLFHLIPPPPAVARPGQLRWADVDWAFFALVFISSILHAAAVVWIQSQPPPTRVALDEVPGFVRIALPPPAPPPEPADAPVDPDAEEPPGQATTSPTPAPAKDPGKSETIVAPSDAIEAPPESADAPDVSKLGLLGLIDESEAPAMAALRDDDREVDPRLEHAIARAPVLPAPRDLGGMRGPRHIDGDGPATIGEIDRPGCCVTPPRDLAPPPPTLEPPPVRTPTIIPEPPIDGSDPAPFLKRLNPGFRSCYERSLKGNPDLTGKLAISFVTDERSRVTEAWIEEDSMHDAAVSACVLKRLRVANLPADAANLEVSGYSLVFVPR